MATGEENALKIKLYGEKGEASEEMLDFPGADDGVRGMAFIDSVVASGVSMEKWTDFKM